MASELLTVHFCLEASRAILGVWLKCGAVVMSWHMFDTSLAHLSNGVPLGTMSSKILFVLNKF